MNRKPFRILPVLFVLGVYLFFYLPILILVIYSFNSSRINAVWTGFTLDWYAKLFSNQQVMEAAKNSLMVAFSSTVISTFLGSISAMGMARYHFRGKGILDGVLYIPIIIPEIVMGIAMLSFFSRLELPLSLWTIIIAHVTFSVPFVIVVVRARMDGFDSSLEEAAADLGASPLYTLRKVTLPLIFPGILAGALMSITLSLDDVIISFFVSGPGSTTLPIKVYSMVRFGVSPEINALSTLMLLGSLTIAIIAEKIRIKKETVMEWDE